MKLLEGKAGLVFGVANHRSIAWGIAEAAAQHGARVGISYFGEKMARRARPLAEAIEAPLFMQCDVQDDAQIDAVFAASDEVFGALDFVVHSLAFADRDDLVGRFVDTGRAGHALALDVSTYSLTALAARARPRLNPNGSLLALSYFGAEKAVPGYNVMGVAKAALEASVRYLAADLGPEGLRVNAISAGPIKTLAAAGIPGFRKMLAGHADKAPLRRNVEVSEVADAAVFLMSCMATGITGEVLHVDAGYNIVGA